MRAFFVILFPPRRDLSLRVEEILKPAHAQTLFPQPSVKTFNPPILRRLARLYVDQFNLPFDTPRQKMPAGAFDNLIWPHRDTHIWPHL